MGSNDTNAKIFVEAELVDNFKRIASTFKSGIEKIDTDIKIGIDNDELKDSIEAALKSVTRMLDDSSNHLSKLDLSSIIPQVFSTLGSNVSSEMKLTAIGGLEETLKSFTEFSKYFEADNKKVISSIQRLNDSLGATGIKKYLEDMQAMMKFIDSLKLSSKDKESMVRSFADSFNVGFGQNGILDAFSLKKIDEQFKDVDKYALSARESRGRLIEELENWQELSEGAKFKSKTTSNIIGYISRIEALSGKEFLQYLSDKKADENLSGASRAQIEKLLEMYTKDGGWGEFIQKLYSSKSKFAEAALNGNNSISKRVVEMTKQQLEARKEVEAMYPQLKASKLTEGLSADRSLVYSGEKEATEELDEQSKIQRDLADKIAAEVEQLKNKLAYLKEIAQLEKDIVTSGVESTPEYLEMQALEQAINYVTKAVNEKTTAFQSEGTIVHNTVASEISDLNSLKKKLEAIAEFSKEEEKINTITNAGEKVRKKGEQRLEESEEEKRKRTEENLRGALRVDTKPKEEKKEDKPKPTMKINTRNIKGNKPSTEENKSALEKEAQAIQDILDKTKPAEEALDSFGQVNEKIKESVIAVADALKKEASALGSISRVFKGFDDSKIVQQARKEKLKDDLSLLQERLEPSKKEVNDFQESFGITLFDKGKKSEATKQLRQAYQEVQKFRTTPSEEDTADPLAQAKKEVKLWKAYKEAERQEIAEVNKNRYNPKNLGITSLTNADNEKALREELEKRKGIYEGYSHEIEEIQKEIEQLENPPSKKEIEKNEAKVQEYQEAISIIKEYVQAQQALADAQKEATPEVTETTFNPEQLEQLQNVFNQINDSLSSIKISLGAIDDDSGVPSVIKSINEMLEVFRKLSTLIDDINNKKIKFGFSSNPDEKLIGEMNSEEVQSSLNVLFDDAIKKIQEFKTNVDMTETVQNFKKQISEMEKAIQKLEKALEREKQKRANDKKAVQIKENLRLAQEKKRAEEIARQEALAKEKEEQERQRKEEEALLKRKQQAEERRLREEQIRTERIAREEAIQKEKIEKEKAQRLYENQFQVEKELNKLNGQTDGQLSFYETLDKNGYDLTKDYLALQKEEAERLAKEAEQNPIEVKAPIEIEGQLSFDNLESGNLFDNMLPDDLIENYGIVMGSNLSESIGLGLKEGIGAIDLGSASDQLLSDLYQQQQALISSAESSFAKISNTKDFIQNEDISQKFLEQYEEIPTTNNLQKLFDTIQQLKIIKAELQDSFDEQGNLIGNPEQVLVAHENYLRLYDIVKKLKLEILGNYSEETLLLKLKQDGQLAEEELEKLKGKIEDTFVKLSGSKDFIQGKDINDNYFNQFGAFANSTDNLNKLRGLFDNLESTKTKLLSSFDDEGKLIGNPEEVQQLLNNYNLLIDKIKKLKLEIASPNSQESLILQLLKDEREAENETQKFITTIEKLYSKLTSSKGFGKERSSIESFLFPYKDVGQTESTSRLFEIVDEIEKIKTDLSSSFDNEGNLIGDPKQVQELISQYSKLIKEIELLKDKIKSPLSEESVALKLAKDAEKASKELDKLKAKLKDKINKSFEEGKYNISDYERYAKVYGQYGKADEEGTRSLLSINNIKDSNLQQQQQKVLELLNLLNQYNDAVKDLREKSSSDIIDLKTLEEADNKVKELRNQIKALTDDLKNNGSKNATDRQVNGLAISIEKFMKQNPRITNEAKKELQDYLNTLKSGETISKSTLDTMADGFRKLKVEQEDLGKTAGGIWDLMLMKMKEGVAFLLTKFSFYRLFNQFRQGMQVVHQFDDALTEMMKVSDETMMSLKRYQKSTFDVADSIGANALQIQQSTADFMRLGESLDEAAKSAKAANILMNVSEFESIDDATKSLIAMSAAYDDLTKMDIIDKLNEVGNNYSISTSGAAEALQASASALKTAGNDMDEALALVTAGNQVVQDTSKTGAGLRTIALRLTGTKSAKEELEEIGEETENVITTQSKLRETIKEATAVASNEFKGFDILDDNGNYKSTYEIMLGISQIYQEILDTDKQFGRNNANLLLETLAGKTRANIAASILQSPDILESAYKSSQEADNSALRENEKYLQSISGHLAKLKNAWQEMWANAANRDILNFFIDLGTAALKLANTIGIIPTTFALLLPYLEIFKKGTTGKGLVTTFLEWANNLNEIKNIADTTAIEAETAALDDQARAWMELATAEQVEATTDAVNVTGSAISASANEAETLSVEEQAAAYIELGMAEEAESAVDVAGAATSGAKAMSNMAEATAGAASSTGLLSGAISGLAKAIGVVPLGIGAVVAGLVVLKKVYDNYRESLFTNAKEATDNISKQQENISSQIDTYKELKEKLDSGNLSEQETLDTKQQILDIQKSITDQYGSMAKGVDLVNGELEKQVSLLNSISQEDALEQYGRDYKGFNVAREEYAKDRNYNVNLSKSNNAELRDITKGILTDSGFDIISSGTGTFTARLKDDASDSIKTLEKARKSLEELKEEYKNPEDIKAIDDQINNIDEQIAKAYETIDKYETTAFKGMELELARNHRLGYDAFKQYQTSTSDLESAYMSGDTKKINEARQAYEEATNARENFLRIGDNKNNFAPLFNSIDTSFVEDKNRYYDTVELLKDIIEPEQERQLFIIETEEEKNKLYKQNTKAQNTYTKAQLKAQKAAKKLYDLNPDRIDIEGTLLDNSYASGKYADALNSLMKELNWSADEASSLVDALVDAGIVQGSAADIANQSADSYKQFSSSVEEAINSLTTLNTVMEESASGKGITDQTIEEFRKAFGEDAYLALEKTANGYHINTQQAYALRQQQEALTSGEYASALLEQYDALERLKDGYEKAISQGKDTSGFIEQRKVIEGNIQKLQDNMMAFNNANSAYQTWLANQSNNGDRQMYESIYSGFETVKDEFEHGWAGIKTRSWMDLMFNDEEWDEGDAWETTGQQLLERWESLSEKIEGTGGYSIADFFKDDGNGKITSDGIMNFFKAVENKQKEVGEEFVNLEEGWFDFTKNGDWKVAEMLGMDVESVQAILRAAAESGAVDIKLDQPLFSIEKLEEKAYEAKDALEKAFGGQLAINLNPDSLEEANSDMAILADYQERLQKDSSIEPKVKAQQLEQLSDLMNLLAAKARELSENRLVDFKIVNSKELDESKNNINEIVNKLSSLSKEEGRYDISDKLKIDPMLLNDADYLEETIKTIKDTIVDPEVDDTQLKYLESLLNELQIRLDLLNGIDVEGGLTVDQLMAAEEVASSIQQKLEYAAQHKNIQFNWDADEEFIASLDALVNLPPELKYAFGIDPDATTEDLLELAKKGELDINVKATGEVPKDTTQTNNTINKTTNITEEKTDRFINTTLDTTDLGEKTREETEKELFELDEFEANPQLALNKKMFDKDSKSAEKSMKMLNATEAIPTVTLSGINQVTSGANTIKSAIDSITGKTVNVHANFTSSGLEGLKSGIQSTLSSARELAQTYIAKFANGTAHAYGTAFAKGKWSTSQSQDALVGELGTEILVTPNGYWQTIGENGAEFAHIPKGSIIFNHKQSEELLKNGYVTSNGGRGNLVGFASGTAFSSGSTSGMISSSSAKKKTSSSSGGSGGSGGSGNSGSGSSSDAKETKNTLDEVEILISRIDREISNLDKTINNTYRTWATRNKAIGNNIAVVTQQIKNQEQAYTTYINKANSVGLSDAWKKKIQSGAFRIEDVTDSDLWDKIQEYQTWYNKALSAKDAVIDLTIKQGDLYKQLFDNEKTYQDEMVEIIQHRIDLQDTFIDRLEETGRLSSKILIYKQLDNENLKIQRLLHEYDRLVEERDKAINSGKIEKGSEAWYEMENAIAEVCSNIEEAKNNVVSYNNALREVDWNRWDKVHDAISGVVNELEFLYDLFNEDDLFDEQGTVTEKGIAAFGLLAHKYDVYFAQAQEYQKEIEATQKQLANDPYNQNLVDKLKELKESQQDAISNAKKTKDSMVDLTEKGIKKQIDYVKKLTDDYKDLLDAQKDQTDYAKKVADQQKEINKLEKQYRAIQNDNSEEGATKRQQLKSQIDEKRNALQETQEDRRISETKDMLSDFEEDFEEFLENKLKNIEGIVHNVVDSTNKNGAVIRDTINELSSTYGYSPSDTLKSALDNIGNNLVSYFDKTFENKNVAYIAESVDKIVDYYNKLQSKSDSEALAATMSEAVRHEGNVQSYRDANGNTVSGYFRSDGTLDTSYNGWAQNNGDWYYFNKGQQLTGEQWVQYKKNWYHLDENGKMQTGWQKVDNQWYYMDKNGTMQTGWQQINGKWYYMNSSGAMQTGWQKVGNKWYYMDKSGAMTRGWQKVDGKYYYMDNTGAMTTGWQQVGNKWYYMNSSGVMTTGWQKVGKKWYYMDASGAAVSGWKKLNWNGTNAWYFFDPSSNALVQNAWIDNNKVTTNPKVGAYYVDSSGKMVLNGRFKTNKGMMTFDKDGKWKGYKTGTSGVGASGLYWTNEGGKSEAIIRKSDGAILTPLAKGDSVIPNNAMKNMYQALTNPAKYLKQFTTPDIRVVQSGNTGNSTPATINMQFIANGVQDANKFANDLMNNKKLEKWIQEVTLGQANGNNSFRKYSYAMR